MTERPPKQSWLNLNHPIKWIFILFLISVMVRIPSLDRPLSKHHEYNTATALIILNSWKQKGIAHFHYTPVQLWPEKSTQTFYKNRRHPLSDENGNLYYTSFPPFGLYLPYFLFSIFGIPFTALSLQILNLLFHFISAVFIFKTIMLFLPNDRSISKLAGLIGCSMYLLSPSSLWFQSNVFFPDVFYTNFFILCTYYTIKIFIRKSGPSFLDLILYTGCLAILTYTDWMGVIFGFVIFNYALYRSFKEKRFLKLLPLTVVGVAVPIALTVWQYSQIHGLSTFIAASIGRFAERGFISTEEVGVLEGIWKFVKRWRFIALHYMTGFLPAIIFIGGLIIIALKKVGWKKILKYEQLPIILVTTFIPVLLHHFIFLKYSMFHDFSVLKAVPFLAIEAGLLIYACRQLLEHKLFYVSLGLVLILSIAQYLYINQPGEFSRNGDRYDAMKNIGLQIRETVEEDEVVFLKGIKGPQIIYYAGRNIFNAEDKDVARRILEEVGAEKGVLFVVEGQEVVDRIKVGQ